MTINKGFIRIVGLLLILGAVIDALALNWNASAASVCRFMEQQDTSLGQTGYPPGCAPVHYTLAIWLAVIGAALLVLPGFVSNRRD